MPKLAELLGRDGKRDLPQRQSPEEMMRAVKAWRLVLGSGRVKPPKAIKKGGR